MKATLLKLYDDLLKSYWFIPALMTLGAIILALVLTLYKGAFMIDWLRHIHWLNTEEVDGARAVLSTIAGSMITVAGVTFSITIAAISYASGQFGPRILSNFMGDRGNQFTLGTFTSTFVYCLMVMRTLNGTDGGEFLPHMAIFIAMLFAMMGIGVLIYYIHHISESIHIAHVVSHIGRDLERTLIAQAKRHHTSEHDFSPAGLGAPPPPPALFTQSAPVATPHIGYVRAVDSQGLLDIACAHDLTIVVVNQPGAFVLRQGVLALVSPASALTPKIAKRIETCFSTGHQRTALQDSMFLVDELVEIAARALSPGINDPFTSMNCLDWLSGAIVQSATLQLGPIYQFGPDDQLRVLTVRSNTPELIDSIFERLRPYFSKDRNASLHMFSTMGSILTQLNPEGDDARQMLKMAEHLLASCRLHLDPQDVTQTEHAYKQLHAIAKDPLLKHRFDAKHSMPNLFLE